MSFQLKYTTNAAVTYSDLEAAAKSAFENRKKTGKSKSSKQEGLFKQVRKTLKFLADNPRHPSLNTHEYNSLEHPFNPDEKVFEAYAQNRTPGPIVCFGAMALIKVKSQLLRLRRIPTLGIL